MIKKKEDSKNKISKKNLEAGLKEIEETQLKDKAKTLPPDKTKSQKKASDKKIKRSKVGINKREKTDKKLTAKKEAKKEIDIKVKEKARQIKNKRKTLAEAGGEIIPKTTVKKEAADTTYVKIQAEANEKSEEKKPAEDEEKLKTRTGWEEEKKLSIKSVIDRELDKEEKKGKLKIRLVPKKKSSLKEIKGGKTLKEKHEDSEKELRRRPAIKKVIEISEGISIKKLSEKINVPSHEIIKFLFNMGEF